MDDTFYNKLVEIADSVEIDGSCSSIMDKVMGEASKRGIYGLTIYAKPINGEERIRRFNSKGEVKSANWQDVFFLREGFIIDVDSPDKVYPVGDYVKKCFINPENVELRLFEES